MYVHVWMCVYTCRTPEGNTGDIISQELLCVILFLGWSEQMSTHPRMGANAEEINNPTKAQLGESRVICKSVVGKGLLTGAWMCWLVLF